LTGARARGQAIPDTPYAARRSLLAVTVISLPAPGRAVLKASAGALPTQRHYAESGAARCVM